MGKNQSQKLSIRDIMTVAAMMVLTFIVTMIIGSITLPFPTLYLYGAAALDAFFGAIFYLVAANRVNKHGLLFIWALVYGLIQGIMGYAFLIPYFLVVGILAELSMIGNNTYRTPLRNGIGWGINSIGNFVGTAVPLWWAWESYQEMALQSGFTESTLDMQFSLATRPELLLMGSAITAALAILGVLFGQKLLKKHFQKSGILE